MGANNEGTRLERGRQIVGRGSARADVTPRQWPWQVWGGAGQKGGLVKAAGVVAVAGGEVGETLDLTCSEGSTREGRQGVNERRCASLE